MLDGYVGQRDRLAPLIAAIEASRKTGRPLPHMLFLGKPGTGKTELAKAVAAEMGVPFSVLHGPNVADRAEVGGKVMAAQGGILFVDEVHALPRAMAEDLFTLLDEGTITVQRPVVGMGWDWGWADSEDELDPLVRHTWRGSPGVYEMPRAVETSKTEPERVVVGDITVIGATTDEALLPPAFLSRLSRLTVRLRPYSLRELEEIAVGHAATLNTQLLAGAAKVVAGRSRNSPRRVKQLTERAVDVAVARRDSNAVYDGDAKEACEALGVDAWGLEDPHRQMLRILAESGGVSRTSLAQRMGIPARNADLYWGELAELGMVTIGRRHEATDAGKAVVLAA